MSIEEQKVASQRLTKQAFPLVSIRIPAYNHDRYVQEALNSIIADNYPNKEVVIINDGSTDKTDEKISEWIEAHQKKIPIKYINRTENKGISKTLNELNSLCRGEFIAGLASDDRLIENGIYSRARYLMDNPQKTAVFGDSEVIDSESKLIYKSSLFEKNKRNHQNYSLEARLRKEIILHWCLAGSILMTRNKSEGYDETLSIEDWDYYIKLVTGNALGFINKKVSQYRIHESNTSSNKEKRKSQIHSLIRTATKHKPALTLHERFYINIKILKLKVALIFKA